jgi:hypothetical protein
MPYTVSVSITIEPLSKIPITSVRDFLISYQHGPDVINWKYYDRHFNGARERGFACVDGDRIVSFLGLIPFTVMHNGKAMDAAWSCDWYRDPNASGPLGIMLIRHSLKAYPLIYSFGGSEMTTAIMGRLSRVTIPTAGLELYKPLRVGGALYGLRKAMRVTHLPSFSTIDNMRLPMRNWKRQGEITIHLLEDLPDNLDGVLSERLTDGHLPAYDLPYLRWLLERCPAITGGVCLVSREEQPIGAILFWRPVADRRFWRVALLPRGRDYTMLEAGLEKVIRHIRDSGGWLISMLASRLDKSLLEVARRHGFYRSNSRRPLYILTRAPDAAPQELEQLTYLDTDYAYRFPSVSS